MKSNLPENAMIATNHPGLLALVLGLFILALSVVISSLFGDLSKIPGPVLARFSRLWIIWVDYTGHRSQTIHALHQKHGPVVRIGPHEVSFSSRGAMRDIYGATNGFIKAPVYEAFGRPSSFTIRNKEAHRWRQKRIAHVFAPAAIADVEPLVHEQVRSLLGALDKRVGQTIDLMEWFRILALDVVGAVFLGRDFGGLAREVAPGILHDLDDVFPSLWIEWQFASIRWLLLCLPIQSLRHFLMAGPNFYNYGASAFKAYISQYGRSGTRRDLLTKLIAGAKDTDPLQDHEIINEMTNLIFAGTDTTSNTFSYMFYELANLPHWQDRLQTELDQVAFTDVPEYKDVRTLGVLDAVIHETLRIHPSAPASLQRVVPATGGVVDGVRVPGDTIVSCQSFTVQRDPEVYPNPATYDPGRWLTASEDQLAAMHDRILVWGKGNRSCLGKQLAYMELKVATAAIMKRFRVELGSATTDDDMEMTDHFTLIAKGRRCLLRLSRREV